METGLTNASVNMWNGGKYDKGRRRKTLNDVIQVELRSWNLTGDIAEDRVIRISDMKSATKATVRQFQLKMKWNQISK